MAVILEKLDLSGGEEEITSSLYTEMYVQSGYTLEEDLYSGVDLSKYSRTVHVSENGDDTTGDGTARRPYRTLDKAFESVGKDSNEAIVIGEGTYDVRAIHDMLDCKGVDFIGNGGKTTVNILSNMSSTVSYGAYYNEVNNKFYGIIFNVDEGFRGRSPDPRVLAFFLHDNPMRFRFYNCVFTDKFSQLSGALFYLDGSSYTSPVYHKGDSDFINCVFDISLMPLSIKNNSTIANVTVSDSVTRTATFGSSGITIVNSVASVTLGSDYSHSDGEVGVYYGDHAWGAKRYGHQINASIQVAPYVNLESSLHVYKDDVSWDIIDHSKDATLPMSSNSSNGQVVSASSQYSVLFAPWKAFDHKNDRWATDSGSESGWIQIKLNSPISMASYAIIAPAVVAVDLVKTPGEWSLYGSNDGATWTLLHSVSNQPIWSAKEKRIFDLEQPTEPFLYFRWDLKAIGGGTIRQLTVGEIEIYAQENWYGSQRRSYISVPYRDDLTSNIFVKPYGYMEAKVNIAPIYHDSMESAISVKNTANVVSAITVPPHGSMELVFDVVPPPRVEVKLETVRDLFVREGIPRLNYGQEHEMVVGEGYDGETFHSLMYFDHSVIPQGLKIVRAELKLYNKKVVEDPVGVSIREVLEDWTEHGTTWANRPMPGEEVAFRFIGKEKGYVTVDLLDIVEKWYTGEKENKGIYLVPWEKGIKEYVRLSTKESGKAETPVLEIEYYDPVVRSIGYLEAETGIIVRQSKGSDLVVSGTVKSDWGFENFPSFLKVHNQDMRESFLTVTRPDMLSKLTVRREEHDGMESTMTIRVRRASEQESSIDVSKPVLVAEGTVRRTEEAQLETSVTVRREGESSLTSRLGITRSTLDGSVDVYKSSLLESSIQVIKQDGRGVETFLIVRRTEESSLGTDIQVWSNTGISSQITIRSGYLASGIIVPYRADTKIRTRINVRIRYASDMTTHLGVFQSSNIDAKITVRQSDHKDLLTEGTVRKTGELDITASISVVSAGAYGLII